MAFTFDESQFSDALHGAAADRLHGLLESIKALLGSDGDGIELPSVDEVEEHIRGGKELSIKYPNGEVAEKFISALKRESGA